jgi:hypothetical protein
MHATRIQSRQVVSTLSQTATNSKVMIYWPSPMLDFALWKTEPAMSSIDNTTVDRAVAVA